MWKDYPKKTLLLQIGLFLATIITTTLVGTEWMYGQSLVVADQYLTWDVFFSGFQYSAPFLFILTVHEFGHFFTAMHYGIRCTLPYYIPIPMSIGTFGAFIRIKDPIHSRKEFFDVGIAGPLAGFAAALGVLWYGFTHLPEPSYIFNIHPEYQTYGLDYPNVVYKDLSNAFHLGNNIIFWFFQTYVAPAHLLPPKYELMHYPFILAGYLALFFTSLNLLPIGQLDGGHVLYGLFGKKHHRWISLTVFTAFVFYAGLGMVTPYMPLDSMFLHLGLYGFFLFVVFRRSVDDIKNAVLLAVSVLAGQYLISYFFPMLQGYNGWMFFAFILGRFLGTTHPETMDETPLDFKRKVLGWIALVIFVLCFSPQPFTFGE